MGKFFDLDSPIMRGLSRMGDLIILNLLVLACCVPVITIGPAFAAMHYVVLKMVRGQEGYVVQGFFKSFKQNFKQGILLWLVEFVLFLILLSDFLIFRFTGTDFPQPFKILLIAITVVFYLVSLYLFPLQARFENKVRHTIKNAFLMAILNLPRTIVMGIICLLPIGLILLSASAVPLLIMFCFSLPALGCAYMYSGVFMRFEPEPEEIRSDLEFSIPVEEEPVEEAEAEVEEAETEESPEEIG